MFMIFTLQSQSKCQIDLIKADESRMLIQKVDKKILMLIIKKIKKIFKNEKSRYLNFLL